ncbi:MAG: hypothetical protein JXB46_01385 [Candidatus Eisenbacteria bacterium]|nr:hypothetical protein [Candidatus Eisenbacteria bacterium]
MLRWMLVAVMVTGAVSSAGAYDLLYSGDVTATHDAGTFGIEGGYLHLSSDQWFREGKLTNGGVMIVDGLGYEDEDAAYTGTFFPLGVRYSPLSVVELGATGVFLMETMSDFDDEFGVINNPLPDFESVGVGDIWLWAKYNFSPEPMLTIRVGCKFPTGEDRPDRDELPTGGGQVDIDGAIMFGVPAGPGWVDAAIGYRLRTRRAADTRDLSSWTFGTREFKPGNEVHFFAGYTQLLGEAFNIRLGADGSFGSDIEVGGSGGTEPAEVVLDSGASILSFNPGIDYLLGNDVWIGADLHYPVMGTNTNAVKGFGLSIGWRM